MARVHRTPFVILGLLNMSPLEPRSGYEIKKAIDSVISHVWSESFGQIYPVLRKLAAEELIRAREVKSSARKKVVYAITAKGRKHLKVWMEKTPEAAKPRDELILKLFFATKDEIPFLIQHLEVRRREAEGMLEQCRHWEKESSLGHEPYHAFLHISARAGVALSEATAQWAEASISSLRKLSSKP